MITFIQIGNSDDKLSQTDWARFCFYVNRQVEIACEPQGKFIGEWHSLPTSPYQNACWMIDIKSNKIDGLKNSLKNLAKRFNQDSIAYTEAEKTEFLSPSTEDFEDEY